MKVPIEWLKDLVDIKIKPEQLARLLTMGGLETVLEADNVLEIDIIPNRADCWSIRGIAREVAALTKTKLKTQNLKLKINEISKNIKNEVTVEVRDKKLCPRYMARAIENVEIKNSPEWLKKRLEQAGLRSINNVVDVTNYLLLELGQPMHAFDADLITERKIIVRRANAKEKVTTLDDKTHELDKDMLVISDPNSAIAVAGVMGAGNTEVNPKTKTIILESAYFDPISIHKTSKSLKLRTDSSIRFEHGVDWQVVKEAVDRGAAMIAELGQGTVLKGKVDVKAGAKKPKVIKLRPARVNQILGTNISNTQMINILKGLGFKVSGTQVAVPFFRAADVYREIDLIEEIARIYGYHKIEATMPNTSFPDKEVDQQDLFRNNLRQILAGCGLNEAQTYSMIGPADFEKTALPQDKAVKIANPMNIEESLMRTSLLPGLLNVVEHNHNRQMENVFVFEIGKVFESAAQKLPAEKWLLTAAVTGSPFISPIDKGEADYFFLKGILYNLFSALGISNYRFIDTTSHLIQPGQGAEIAGLGFVGALHPDIVANYKVNKPVFFFEIDLHELIALAKKERRYKSLPKYPYVYRDIAMFAPKGIGNQMIISAIKEAAGHLAADVFLFDKYKDSLAYRVIYRSAKDTLTDTEVNSHHHQVIAALVSKLNVRIR